MWGLTFCMAPLINIFTSHFFQLDTSWTLTIGLAVYVILNWSRVSECIFHTLVHAGPVRDPKREVFPHCGAVTMLNGHSIFSSNVKTQTVPQRRGWKRPNASSQKDELYIYIKYIDFAIFILFLHIQSWAVWEPKQWGSNVEHSPRTIPTWGHWGGM